MYLTIVCKVHFDFAEDHCFLGTRLYINLIKEDCRHVKNGSTICHNYDHRVIYSLHYDRIFDLCARDHNSKSYEQFD